MPPDAPHSWIFTSESVSEGHPDKVADFIADSILDAHLEQDPHARVACEVLVKTDQVILAGEITSTATVDEEAVAREAIRSIGYVRPDEPFNADGVKVTRLISHQVAEIAQGVDTGGAGDQGIMFGFAASETPSLMPLPISLAEALAARLAADRHGAVAPWLRPDAKTQVSVEYTGLGIPLRVRTVLVSTQHGPEIDTDGIRDYLLASVIPETLDRWWTPDVELLVNPTGSFVEGGPSADAGVTGRRIIADTYGGMGRHGGGAFSGKDPTKVDRSGAYFARFAARQVVIAELATRCELQVAYAIGVDRPVSVHVETFGTGDARLAEAFVRDHFDFRPEAITERLGLRRPIYRSTTNYGHFGRPGLPWEESGPAEGSSPSIGQGRVVQPV